MSGCGDVSAINLWNTSNQMIVKAWIWKPLIAGLSGTLVHFLFMYFKTRAGILPSFQPYQTLQLTLNRWVGTDVPAFVPWALSFVNGMAILGFLFAPNLPIAARSKWHN